MKEYVIWGVPPNCKDEELLVAKIRGKNITEKEDALFFLDVMVATHNCTNCRIQEIDLTDNNINFNI